VVRARQLASGSSVGSQLIEISINQLTIILTIIIIFISINCGWLERCTRIAGPHFEIIHSDG
jgi:hypothetical protein